METSAVATISAAVEKPRAKGKRKASQQQVYQHIDEHGDVGMESQQATETRADRYSRREMARRVREKGLMALEDQLQDLQSLLLLGLHLSWSILIPSHSTGFATGRIRDQPMQEWRQKLMHPPEWSQLMRMKVSQDTWSNCMYAIY